MNRYTSLITHPDQFQSRHIGPHSNQTPAMLNVVGEKTMEDFISKVVPDDIRLRRQLDLPEAVSEHEALTELRAIAAKNKPFRSFIGMGYSDCILPSVIQRNILENPGWYTQYTPYQAEISQGRLEALLNFQTMVCDLTGMAIANASLLDEATAAAEALHLALAAAKDESRDAFYVSKNCHPQTIAVVRTRADALGVKVIAVDEKNFQFTKKPFAILLQYPGTDGTVPDLEPIIAKAHEAGALAIVAADILALTLLRPPGEMGADVVLGNTQRFGMPYGLGGPHAAFFATKDEFKRIMPGRLIGVSKDTSGNPALRLSLQTREQHIRREKATSNICTAQALPAIVASMYAIYHGPENLKKIAKRVFIMAMVLRLRLKMLGHEVSEEPIFDTVRVTPKGATARKILSLAKKQKINFRLLDSKSLTIALDEVTSKEDVEKILSIFPAVENAGGNAESLPDLASLLAVEESKLIPKMGPQRKTHFLTHPIFNTHHSETEMLRYMRKLESRDLSLNYSMIPLGSCTMKLNATAEMAGITWPEFANVHPYSPVEQHEGYAKIISDLEKWLAEITGFKAVSLQPNAGSAGEYTGLLAIRKYHQSRNESHRNVCLIPTSAHGTNPASAAMAGMQVVLIKCNELGNIDLVDLEEKATAHAANLAAIMVTYPSTHGVFEAGIRKLCEIVHAHGGQVYMDGANMNAQVGLCRPADIGADVCHLNLHKTFCIPHGGGGPGMGPIGVAEHLVPFLPSHPLAKIKSSAAGAVAAAPYGSGLILIIPWMYIRMMGPDGLADASRYAILSANYMARRLEKDYPILYKGEKGYVAHECILDCHSFKDAAGIEVEDIAKRLIDYGFHAPTMSWPVHNTLMVEPTESEPLVELDRFCDAMISIRKEIDAVAAGTSDKANNALKNSPHTASVVTSDKWERPYSREQAAFPTAFVRENKFWPYVGRVDNVYGDRNLFCSCQPIEAHS